MPIYHQAIAAPLREQHRFSAAAGSFKESQDVARVTTAWLSP